jgi:hypothetical protein
VRPMVNPHPELQSPQRRMTCSEPLAADSQGAAQVDARNEQRRELALTLSLQERLSKRLHGTTLRAVDQHALIILEEGLRGREHELLVVGRKHPPPRTVRRLGRHEARHERRLTIHLELEAAPTPFPSQRPRSLMRWPPRRSDRITRSITSQPLREIIKR